MPQITFWNWSDRESYESCRCLTCNSHCNMFKYDALGGVKKILAKRGNQFYSYRFNASLNNLTLLYPLWWHHKDFVNQIESWFGFFWKCRIKFFLPKKYGFIFKDLDLDTCNWRSRITVSVYEFVSVCMCACAISLLYIISCFFFSKR